MNGITKIILVDDEPLLLESLKLILSMEPDFEVVGDASDGVAALKLLKRHHADIALVDLRMVGMGGLQLITELRQLYAHMRILVLTTFYDEKSIVTAIHNGADGYILKDAGRGAIVNAIRSVAKGQSLLDMKVMSALAAYVGKTKQSDLPDEKDGELLKEMTSRELDVCRLLAGGYTNAEIAEKLFLTEGTVKNYISKIYDKAAIRDRATLAVYLSKIIKDI